MIISCEKCNKKFEISDNLIPDEGRLLECGSCSYQWNFIPQNRIKLKNEVIKKDNNKRKNYKNQKNELENISTNNISKKIEKKKIGFLSYLIVIIISFIAVIILLDTFSALISSFIPGIDFYLSSLYESLKDIMLFFTDLIK